MSKVRTPVRRVDGNQKEIVRDLRRIGASVLHLHTLGHGSPDLLIGFRGENYLLEVKRGNGKLTADETEFFSEWRGQKAIVRNSDEAIAVLTESSKTRAIAVPPVIGVLHNKARLPYSEPTAADPLGVGA